MALYEREEEVLVGSCNNNTYYAWGVADFWWVECDCPLHLYAILINRAWVMKNDASKSTLLVITVGFLAIFIIFSWRWALITSFAVGIIGIVSSTASKIIDKGWMALAHLLGSIVTPLVLSIIFFLILVPVSLVSRLFTKDPLMLSEKYSTYFVDVDRRFDKSDFEKTW